MLHRLFHLGFGGSHQREPIMCAGFPVTSLRNLAKDDPWTDDDIDFPSDLLLWVDEVIG